VGNDSFSALLRALHSLRVGAQLAGHNRRDHSSRSGGASARADPASTNLVIANTSSHGITRERHGLAGSGDSIPPCPLAASFSFCDFFLTFFSVLRWWVRVILGSQPELTGRSEPARGCRLWQRGCGEDRRERRLSPPRHRDAGGGTLAPGQPARPGRSLPQGPGPGRSLPQGPGALPAATPLH